MKKIATLSKGELAQFKKLLHQLKDNLQDEIRYIAKGAAKSQREAAGDISSSTYHMADVATDHYDRELSLNIASTEQRVLYAIDEALKRIEDKSFGMCLACGKRIPSRRLKAVPYAPHCIACQQILESRSH